MASDDEDRFGCALFALFVLGLLIGFIVTAMLPIAWILYMKGYDKSVSLGRPESENANPYSPNTPGQDIHVSSVTVDRETIAKEIRDISVPFNNCSGTGEISQEYETSETLKHEYALGTVRTVNFEISILLAELQKEVSFGLEEIETKRATTNIKASARSNVEYIITTREIWQKGIIHAEVNQESMQIPFEVRSNIDAVITGSKSLPCPTIQTQ